MEIKKLDAGVWVKASEPPNDEKVYPVILNNEIYDSSHYRYNGWMVDSTQYKVTQWLKPVTGYLLTEDELETVYRKGYNDMYNNAGRQYTPEVDFKQFIQSITNQ